MCYDDGDDETKHLVFFFSAEHSNITRTEKPGNFDSLPGEKDLVKRSELVSN